MRFAAALGAVVLAGAFHSVLAAPVPVKFTEGLTRGFLVLSEVNGEIVAHGDLYQSGRGDEIDKHMVFHFKDGSTLDEKVTYTQRGVFALKSYQLVEKGPLFKEDREISLTPATGAYRVRVKDRSDGDEEILEDKIELPADVYNGLIMTLLNNLPKGAGETVHYVAFTPKPRLIELVLTPAGEESIKAGDSTSTARHYLIKPQLGVWLKLFATITGRVPPDLHGWVANGEVPAFVGYEGTLGTQGQVWRVETNSPRRSR